MIKLIQIYSAYLILCTAYCMSSTLHAMCPLTSAVEKNIFYNIWWLELLRFVWRLGCLYKVIDAMSELHLGGAHIESWLRCFLVIVIPLYADVAALPENGPGHLHTKSLQHISIYISSYIAQHQIWASVVPSAFKQSKLSVNTDCVNIPLSEWRW
jgi:hypothetical protein